MNDWKKICVSPQASVLDAMKVIDKVGTQFVMVMDGERLIGSVTDGDIRRGILRNIGLNAEVTAVMNSRPLTMPVGTKKEDALNFLKMQMITHLPLVKADGTVASLIGLEDANTVVKRTNTVVLMVGGLGTRLGELTSNCPKPMLKIGGRPVLEVIVSNLKEHRFSDFIFCVNYRAEMIHAHFGDGTALGVRIRYIHEEKRMGTAGALSLLPSDVKGPILVMNGDIVTKVNFTQFLDFHTSNTAKGTMGVRKFDFQIPFGVVETVDGRIERIEEKPVHSFMVSAGIYVLETELLSRLPSDTFFDMPQLFETAISAKEFTQAFPIHEYWLDIGREADLTLAQEEFAGVAK